MLQSTKHKAYNNNKINNNLKQAFTLLELSIVITVISVLLTTMLVSKVLIRSAKINKVYQDYRDINALMNIFQNTFGCLPGDCNITELPMTVINGTPSGCFNLSTTTGMGNENTTGNSVGTTSALSPPIIAAFGTGTISTNANRTCAFYEMQAFEPTAFGGRAAKNSLFKINSAMAIGTGGVLNIVNNPIIAAALVGQTVSLNAQIAANNTTIANNQTTMSTNQQNMNNAVSDAQNIISNNACGYSINASSISSGMGGCTTTFAVIDNVCLNQGRGCSNSSTSYNTQVGIFSTNQSSYNTLLSNNSAIAATNTGLQNQLTALFNPNNYISLSIPTATNPLMPSFQNQAMWELSTVGSNGSAGFYPYELNDTTNMGYMKNQTLLIARSSSTNNITDTTNDMSAFDSNFAFKIDQKYDDGMPYTGSIIAGQNISQMSPGGTGCTTATTISVATPTASPTANYITSNSSNLTFGCVVGFGLRLT